jgi:SAM-dependent methyltransferase
MVQRIRYAGLVQRSNLRIRPASLTSRPGHHFANYESTTSVPELVSTASGVVLELGPATGNQLPRYKIANLERIYGIAPNPAFFSTLHSKIKETCLEDKYTTIIGGIEDEMILKEHGIVDESMDCMVSMQVFCSVKNVPESVETIWRLLSPGGTLIFWEHHQSGYWLTRRMQGM